MNKLLIISFLCFHNIAFAQQDSSFSKIKLQGQWSYHVEPDKSYLNDCWGYYSFSNDTIEISHGSTGERIYLEMGTFTIQGDSIKVVPTERLTISGNTGFPTSHYKNNHNPHFLPIEYFIRKQEDKVYIGEGKVQFTFSDCFSHIRKTKETVFIDPDRIKLSLRDRKPQSTDY